MIVHLTFCAPQVVVRGHMFTNVYLTGNILQRVEVNLEYFRVETSRVSRLHFIEKELTDGSLVYSEPNKQATFH